MFSQFAKNTLSPEFVTKSIPCNVSIPDLNQKLTTLFLKTYDLYEMLFTLIKSEDSFYTKPEPLRHPLIFYFGHTASFFVNKLMDRGLLKQHLNEEFQRIFAVGVDQNDWDDLDETHYSWPSVTETRKFRNQVKKAVLNVISQNKETLINYKSNMWAILMAIDHQKLHIETSAVIIRRLPCDEVMKQPWAMECPFQRDHPSKVPLNFMKYVPETDFLYEKDLQKASFFGWDSEFGRKRFKTSQFKCSKMLVSNAEFLQFFLDDGYKNMTFWTDQGKKWISKDKVLKPVFWILKGDVQNIRNYDLKTLTGQIPMPWDWPVEVNNLEARAFCNWKSQKTGKKIRLPTEEEYFSLRNLLKTDSEKWEYQSVGNINLEYWCSPCPIDLFEIQGFCDIVGNVLQHTITPFYPFENFKTDPLYEDFSTPAFDGRHDIIKGGCFMNTGNSSSMSYRTGFRRHFYLFTGFRYVESDSEFQMPYENLNQSDQCVKEALNLHFLNEDSYISKIVKFLSTSKIQFSGKSLVIGCSVGRLNFQLAKYFEISYGIDYTARYFQMASRLVQKGELSYQNLKISLRDVNISSESLKKVRLYQMNPLNFDSKKINGVNLVVIDGFAIKPGTVKDVIKSCLKVFEKDKKSYLIIIWPYQKDELQSLPTLKNKLKVLESFELQNQTDKVKQKAFCYFAEVIYF